MAFNWHRGREGPSPERESPAPPPQQHDYRTATPAAYTTSQGSQPHSPSSRGGSPFVGAPQARGGEGPPSWERRYGGLPRYSQQQQQQQYMQQMLLLEQPQQQQQVGVGAEIEALQQQCRDSLRSSLRIAWDLFGVASDCDLAAVADSANYGGDWSKPGSFQVFVERPQRLLGVSDSHAQQAPIDHPGYTQPAAAAAAGESSGRRCCCYEFQCEDLTPAAAARAAAAAGFDDAREGRGRGRR
ncbi:hypothetical protein Esti_000865 [Eimeria stiedai]